MRCLLLPLLMCWVTLSLTVTGTKNSTHAKRTKPHPTRNATNQIESLRASAPAPGSLSANVRANLATQVAAPRPTPISHIPWSVTTPPPNIGWNTDPASDPQLTVRSGVNTGFLGVGGAVHTELAPPPSPTRPPARPPTRITRPPSPLRLVNGELATAPPGRDPGYTFNQGDPAIAQLNTRNVVNLNVANLAVTLGGEAPNTDLAPPPPPTHPPTRTPPPTRPPSPLRLVNGELATAPPGRDPGYVANWGDPEVQVANVAQLSVNPVVGLNAGAPQTEELQMAHCGCDACTCCCVSSSCSCCGSCGHSLASMATARIQQQSSISG